MTTKVPLIHISDMANPDITPSLAAWREGPVGFPCPLTADEILARARTETGLDDFGEDTGFRDRLAVILTALYDDEGLTRGGRIFVLQQAVRAMANRLRIEDLVKRHPEILDVVIDRPVFIAGLPRSGTTHLVNWLSRDERLNSLTLWESEEPVPAAALAPGEADPRMARTAAFWEAFGALLPHMAAMHEMAANDIHEDNELLFMDMNCYNWEFSARLPRWTEYYLSHDRTPSYAYEKKVLQVLSWLRAAEGRRRWLLKSPQHMENFAAIKSIFPDASVIVTHRDPVDVLRSLTTMLGYSDRTRRDPVDPPGLARLWADRIERLLRECVSQREAFGPSQSLDVLFHEYMDNQEETARHIYSVADLDLPPATEAKLLGYLSENPRHSQGKVVYDLEGVFGMDIAALRRRFAFYYERFPVKQEN
jgi:hypothetical protein